MVQVLLEDHAGALQPGTKMLERYVQRWSVLDPCARLVPHFLPRPGRTRASFTVRTYLR